MSKAMVTAAAATFTRKNGDVVEMVEGNGYTMRDAQRIAGKDTDAVGMALASLLVRVNGAAVVYEEFMAWPLSDVMKAVTLASEQLGNAVTPENKTS